MNAPEANDHELAIALAECERLREENRRLREQLGTVITERPVVPVSADTATVTQGTVTAKSPAEEKVKLFRRLFRGRDDIYAARWEGRNGKTGYSPDYR